MHASNPSESSTPIMTRRMSRSASTANGLVHANEILGYEAFKSEEWKIEGIYDEKSHKHQASYVALKTIHGRDFSFEGGEKIHLEDAFKYSGAQSDALWHAAGLIPQMSYGNKTEDYRRHPCQLSPILLMMTTRPPPPVSSQYQFSNQSDRLREEPCPVDE